MVTGIRSLCTGLGPAIFGLLFQLADISLDDNKSSSTARMIKSTFPGAPFLVGTGFVLIALFVALTIPGWFPFSRRGMWRGGATQTVHLPQ